MFVSCHACQCFGAVIAFAASSLLFTSDARRPTPGSVFCVVTPHTSNPQTCNTWKHHDLVLSDASHNISRLCEKIVLEHCRSYGLGMDALVRFGHGCSGQRNNQKMNGIMVGAWMFWSAPSFKEEQDYGLGMDAMVSVCSWNTNEIVVIWAWMLWFGHGCSGQRNSGLGRGCSRGTILMSVWAWMLW